MKIENWVYWRSLITSVQNLRIRNGRCNMAYNYCYIIKVVNWFFRLCCLQNNKRNLKIQNGGSNIKNGTPLLLDVILWNPRIEFFRCHSSKYIVNLRTKIQNYCSKMAAGKPYIFELISFKLNSWCFRGSWLNLCYYIIRTKKFWSEIY